MAKKFTFFNHSLLGKLWQNCAIFDLTLFCTDVDLVRAPYFSSTYNNVFSHIIVRWVIEFQTRGYIQKRLDFISKMNGLQGKCRNF